MTSFTSRFNDAANIRTRHIGDLVEGTAYKVTWIKRVKTRFGDSIVTVLTDTAAGGEVFETFLPSRYAAVFTAELLEAAPGVRGRQTCGQSLRYMNSGKVMVVCWQ